MIGEIKIQKGADERWRFLRSNYQANVWINSFFSACKWGQTPLSFPGSNVKGEGPIAASLALIIHGE